MWYDLPVMEILKSLDPIAQALVATCFTWLLTALGAAVVFVSREIERRLLDLMLGFAGGVMVAASFWSLLAPAINMSKGGLLPIWLPPPPDFFSAAPCSASSIGSCLTCISAFPLIKRKG
jgi:ZIP family zinc transporter